MILSSNSNIELLADPARTVIINDNLTIERDLTIQGDLYSDDLTVRTQATGLSIFVDDILVQENFITTTASNADLELRANGTGRVNITDQLEVINDVTVIGDTTLLNTQITNLVLLGQLTQTGDIDHTGDLSITGNISADQFTNGDIIVKF